MPQIHPKRCPICQTANQCQANRPQACWCSKVHFPEGLLALVPEEQKRRSCICQDCLKNFKADPLGFSKIHR
ncbi:cysteine-rich CWC family protein [Kiritimatiellaeota bacterium B1221]|nr:cysteine-rich CWC family protein [Kiritimatiellaeota bacterium B1221]